MPVTTPSAAKKTPDKLALAEANKAQRLHWTAYGISFIALIALFLGEGYSFVLPFLGIALAVSAVVPYRYSGSAAPIWMLRIALWAAIFAQNMTRTGSASNDFFYLKFAWFGEPLMAELVLQVWKKRPEGGGRGVVTLFLSGLVFLIGCNIHEDGRSIPYMLYLAPLYMLLLILAVRHFRAFDTLSSSGSPGVSPSGTRSRMPETPYTRRAARMRQGIYALMVAVALGMGMGVHHSFRRYRNELTSLGLRLLADRQWQRMGLSTSPHLGRTDGLKGSPERVAQIYGDSRDNHWRVLSFIKYNLGGWGPSREVRKRTTLSMLSPPKQQDTKAEAKAEAAAESVTVTRLIDNNGLLYAPLHTVSLDPLESGDLEWAEAEGGPITVKTHALGDYVVDVSNDEAYQGVLCTPLSAANRVKLLEVPDTVDPGVRQLATTIVADITKPKERAEAIEHYLMTNYHYSLAFNPGRGDPVSKFLLNHGVAHCEYFASSAVILLRYAGVPARYVIGYYAHEKEGPGITVIRQRDAHAWAECWIEGLGWIIIDGTPGPGRPDALAGPIPLWQRTLEWVQDVWQRLQDWLSGSNGLKAGGVIGTIAFIVLGWQWWKQTRRPQVEKGTAFVYSSPHEKFEQLVALSARFTQLGRRCGLVCPPQQTWQEYLESPAAAAAAQDSGFNVTLADAFIRDYNTARFGVSPSEETLTALETQLTTLETLAFPQRPK